MLIRSYSNSKKHLQTYSLAGYFPKALAGTL